MFELTCQEVPLYHPAQRIVAVAQVLCDKAVVLPRHFIGLSIPIDGASRTCGDAMVIAEALMRKGAIDVRFDGRGESLRLCAFGYGFGLRISGNWLWMTPWPRKTIKFLTEEKIPYCTKLTGSNKRTLALLEMSTYEPRS
ncbi:MAG: hypothetical protein NUV88_01100 [Candidatus Kaiserbacteria bacterium]|nr:hypothetical protein [Candidatus Kaiserbacteria bacterium]